MNDVILEAAPVTLWLVIGGAVFWLLLGDPDRHPLGAQAALALRPVGDASSS